MELTLRVSLLGGSKVTTSLALRCPFKKWATIPLEKALSGISHFPKAVVDRFALHTYPSNTGAMEILGRNISAKAIFF